MVLRSTVDESGAGKRSPAIVERDCRTLPGHGVHLTRKVHVQRLRERGRILVRKLRTRQQRTELRINLRDSSGRTVRLGRNVRKKLLQPRNDLLDRASAHKAEELNLVMSMKLRLAGKGRLVSFIHIHKLSKSGLERLEIRGRQSGHAVELRPREEMHTLHRMVVAERGGYPFAALRNSRLYSSLGPCQRLYAPLKAALAEVLESLVVPFGHHDILHTESKTANKPIV